MCLQLTLMKSMRALARRLCDGSLPLQRRYGVVVMVVSQSKTLALSIVQSDPYGESLVAVHFFYPIFGCSCEERWPSKGMTIMLCGYMVLFIYNNYSFILWLLIQKL